MVGNNNTLKLQLSNAFQLIQQGELDPAVIQLQALIKRAPNNPDIPHLLALAHKAQQSVVDAKRYFLRSLELKREQPQVHNNLANLYKSTGQFAEAEKHYRLAIKLQEGFIEPQTNLALCMVADGRLKEAEKLYRTLTAKYSGDAKLLSAFGDCCRLLEDYSSAIKQYKAALEVEPKYVNAVHNLGVIYHFQGRLEKAQDYYQEAYQLAPLKAEVVQSYANIVHELGDTYRSLNILSDAVEQLPGAHILHERLNELLWEVGQKNDFGKSYLVAINREPENLQLYLSQAKQLFHSGASDKALTTLRTAIARFGDEPKLLGLRAHAFAGLGETELAKQDLVLAQKKKFTKEGAHTLTKILIVEQAYEAAQKQIDRLMNLDAKCQLTLALQSIVWRMTKDNRYQWLCNFSDFIRPFKLEPPDGYHSLEQFLSAVAQELSVLHNTRAAPLEQTLQGGTQTAPRLLHKPITVLQELKQCLTSIVEKYISELPNDSSHPFLCRKSAGFDFSGSWSVKLEPEGFHVNHVHPAGWISSSCYIVLPNTMQAAKSQLVSDQLDASPGAIKFGESPFQLGEFDSVEKIILPEAGMVVLFPSYMWHGTYPFGTENNELGSGYRLTAPFDVVPK